MRDRKSEMKSRMVEYSSHESPYMIYVNSTKWDRLVEKHEEDYSPNIANKLRSFKVEIRSYKEDNNKLIEA